MNFQEFQNKFLEWTENEIEAKKLDGFPVCPFARKARLQNKIQFIDARDNQMDTYELFDRDTYEIGIAWVDGCDMREVEEMCTALTKKHTDLLYFTSTTSSGHFVKNFTNCVFIQCYVVISLKSVDSCTQQPITIAGLKNTMML